jgi:hypothetical protein
MTKAKCKLCEDVIESRHRHDFVECKCGEIFLDGGDDYLRAGAKKVENFVLLKGVEDKKVFRWKE